MRLWQPFKLANCHMAAMWQFCCKGAIMAAIWQPYKPPYGELGLKRACLAVTLFESLFDSVTVMRRTIRATFLCHRKGLSVYGESTPSCCSFFTVSSTLLSFDPPQSLDFDSVVESSSISHDGTRSFQPWPSQIDQSSFRGSG